MSQQVLFSVKIESVKYVLKDSTLSLTNPFDEYDIKTIVSNRLKKEGWEPDYNSFKYIVKEGQLYIEGKAYKLNTNKFVIANEEND